MKRFAVLAFTVVITTGSHAGETVRATTDCPAATTLSSFEKAMTASLNNQDLVVAKLEMEGKVLTIKTGTSAQLEEVKFVLGRRMEVVRVVFPFNPNGDYGVWTLRNCFQ